MHIPPSRSAPHRALAAARAAGIRWAGEDRALDVLIALSCFALMVLDLPGLAKADNSLNPYTAPPVLALGAATLLLRRSRPWVPYLVSLLFLGWLHQLNLVQFALYSIGRFRGRRAGILATCAYIAVAYVLFNLPGWPDTRGETLSSFLAIVVPVGVLACGVGVSAYRHDLVHELEAQRAETSALQAVQAERVSVARDVHDMVGRELTMLAVRSEVLAVRARNEPHHKDFEELADTARRAHLMLNEIIVRRADARTATPGIDGLHALAEESRGAGTPVGLDIEEAAHRLSPLRQAAVYRVVQECLTNAVKHAQGEPVAVTIRLAGGDLVVTVQNPLPRSAPVKAPVSTGTGTFSMRERVESMGGSLATTRTDTAYEVRATLPAGAVG
ncbi:sensor histidine kinase [Streptomyces sp. NPDC048111]|uniref:sensor histidine kinase n=1 Tax=Streptomyces sp. NPDC048111 TaxID=3365500 RepID=UPI00371FD138